MNFPFVQFPRFSNETIFSNKFWQFRRECCTINCYFEYRNRILCVFLYVGTYFKDMFRHFRQTNRMKSQTCEQCSYEILWGIFFGFWVPNGPLTSLKHPSEGYFMDLRIYPWIPFELNSSWSTFLIAEVTRWVTVDQLYPPEITMLINCCLTRRSYKSNMLLKRCLTSDLENDLLIPSRVHWCRRIFMP